MVGLSNYIDFIVNFGLDCLGQTVAHTGNTGFASGGCRTNLELCASNKYLC